MRFVANLRNETIDAFATEGIQPAAYLLSSHRLTATTLAAAIHIRQLGLPLFADNGTKPLIDDIRGEFSEAAAAISTQLKPIQHALGRVPRGKDIPAALRRRAADLAELVVANCTARSDAIDTDELIERQMSMAPTDLIAQEDFAIACLIGLDLDRHVTGWNIGRFETRNRRSLELWRRVADDRRCSDVRVHAVLSAMDYNTAVAAGRLAARAGVRHAALGFAGINLDRRATDFYVMGFASHALQPPVPRRYVRLAQIAAGLTVGIREAGGSLASFHCLGLGAPPMFPIVAAGLDPASAATLDSTSPIHDAVRDHVLYDPSAEGQRRTVLAIVRAIVAGDDWPFLSPFTQAFRATFGHDPDAARAWVDANAVDPVTSEHLAIESDLTRALPLFATADPTDFSLARKVWIAHNHWVLDRLADRFSGDDRRALALASLTLQAASSSTVTTRGLAAATTILEQALPSGPDNR